MDTGMDMGMVKGSILSNPFAQRQLLILSPLEGTWRGLVPTAIGALLAFVAPGGWAQTDTSQDTAAGTVGKRVFSVTPRVSVTETFTDNLSLTTTGKQSELITEISPGLRLTSDGGRVKGYLDYSLQQTLYAQNSTNRGSKNALNTFGSVEAVDNWAYLDFSGTISQQAISALGTQSASAANINSNLTESTTFRLSPYLRGRVGSFANYLARYSAATNRSQSVLVSDVVNTETFLQIDGLSAGRLAWAIAASRKGVSYSGAGRATEADSLNATLKYTVTPQLNVSLTGGQESNNYATLGKDATWTTGFAANWHLSESTQFSLSRQTHSFGASHGISFDHRTARTAWRFSDSQDVSSTPSQTGNVGLGSTYDLYFAQFASLEPDPVKRAALVSNFLQANGINPNTTVVSGFLTSAVSLQRRQDLSFALLGVRDTVTFTATRSEGSRLDAVVGVNDDLANSAVLRQQGFSVNYGHKLTPHTALNGLVSMQRSSGSQSAQDVVTNLVSVSVSTKVGAQSTALFSVRRTAFESGVTPYTETAITSTLNVPF